MPSIIAEFLKSRKVQDGALVVLIACTATAAFGLGRMSRISENPSPVVLHTGVQQAVGATSLTQENGSAVAAVAGTAGASATSYVASKSGKIYHLPWCSGAKRISENNKVWFSSKQEAEAAGYRAAANCKGI